MYKRFLSYTYPSAAACRCLIGTARSTTHRCCVVSASPITPDRFDAVLFDLDGVLTSTARIHCALLENDVRRVPLPASGGGTESFRPFDIDADYKWYVDGKPRYDGVRSFLASRDISLAGGDAGRTRRPPTPCAVSAIARTSWSRRRSTGARSRPTPGRSPSSAGFGIRASAPRWCRRATTASKCCVPWASSTCSTRGSTAWSRVSSSFPENPHRTRSSRPRRCSGVKPCPGSGRGGRHRRRRRLAGRADSAWLSAWIERGQGRPAGAWRRHRRGRPGELLT